MSVQAMRTFAAIDLSVESVPDATTEEAEGNSGGRWTGEPLLKFRHLLEAHGLTRQLFQAVGALLEERQLLMREGTIASALRRCPAGCLWQAISFHSIVDATIIAAPCSTRNARKERDPQMHQTRKGNQWYFGMKAHIGVDAHSGVVHSLSATAANVADIAGGSCPAARAGESRLRRCGLPRGGEA